jgi:molybdate transport system substrate-binding protein
MVITAVLGVQSAGCRPRPSPPGEVVVFAAASLEVALREVGESFERTGAGRAVFNFAGSNTLARQIEAGSRADVFLSADYEWMDSVERAGRLEPGSRVTILGNSLVVVVRSDSRFDARSLTELASLPIRGLAMGDPEAVPVGRYARSALGSLWPAVSDRVVPAPDARAALALVESDPEIVGIVYRTDAGSSRRVRVLFQIPGELAVPIRYVAAALADAPNRDGGHEFLSLLLTETGQEIFERHGFSPAPRESR